MSHTETAPVRSAGTQIGRSRLWNLPALLLVAGGLAVCLPYVLLPTIPGIDYPNHLARLAVLGAAPGSPILRSFAPHWALMPDLGLDLVYMALKGVASPETVLRLCLAGSLVMMLRAFCLIQRTLFGRITASAILVPLCLTGLPVLMGYINFVMGVALVMTGAWLCLAWRERMSAARILMLAGFLCLVWLCHFAAFAALVIFTFCVLASTFSRGFRLGPICRAGLITAVIALPGLVMTVFAEPETGRAGFEYGLQSLRSLFAPVMSTGTPFDYLVWIGTVTILAALAGFGTWRLAQPARAGVLVLLLIVASVPWRIGAASYDVGARLTEPAWLLFLAASCIEMPRRLSDRAIIVTACVALMMARESVILGIFRQDEAVVAAFRAAAQKMPAGATLMQATDEWRAADCSRASTKFSSIGLETHLAAYAVRDRGAWEPFIFAAAGKQPIRSSVDFAPAALKALDPPALDRLVPLSHDGKPPPDTSPPDKELPPGWPEHYDYLLVVGRGCAKNPDPAVLEQQAQGPGFLLYRLRRPAGS